MKWLLLAAVWLPVAGTLTAAGAPEVVFEGNTLFPATTLSRALARYDVKIADDVTTADDGAFFLREFYFLQGFPDAEVDYTFSPSRVVFSITEGPRFRLGRVAVEGGDGLGHERVREVFLASLRQATRTPIGRLRFVPHAIDDAAARVRSTFVANGFLNAQVTAEVADGMARDVMDVTLRIDEGVPFRIQTVRVEGPPIPEEAELRKALEPFQNQSFRPKDEALVRSRTSDFLRSHGYYHAAVDVRWEADSDGFVQIVASIAPGRKMFIGHIAASGLSRTASRAFLRKFGIRTGKEFDATAMDAAERRLWFTGAFSGVDVKTTPRSDGTVDVDLTVEEGKARHLSTTVGYSQWDRAFLNATFVDRNVFGSLNRFSLEGFVSQRSFGGVATLADPWLFGHELTGRITAFALRRELPAFRAVQYGALLGLSGRRGDRNLTGWGLDYERRTIADAVIFSGNESDALDDYTIGMVSFHQQLDTRNSPLAPMSGYNLRYDAGVASEALLGDVSFFRLTAQATWYLPLRKILPERPFVPVLILNHRAGVILPYSNTDEVPVPERFFLGGPDSVRSFQLDGMAPRDDEGVPTGGQAFFLANIELQWPIWQGIFLAAFTDVGNLAPEIDAMAWDETRIAPGAGVRLYTPLGALRLDYGVNLVRRDGDPFGNWQFGLGFTF